MWFEDLATLRRAPGPYGQEPPIQYPSAALSFAKLDSLPHPMSPFIDMEALAQSERATYASLVRERSFARPAGEPEHQLLGYPSEPLAPSEERGDSRLLLQLDTDESLGFAWGRVLFMGNDDDVRRAHFGNVWIAHGTST